MDFFSYIKRKCGFFGVALGIFIIINLSMMPKTNQMKNINSSLHKCTRI